MTLHIAGICGSLRRDSINRRLLRAMEEIAPELGARIEEVAWREFPVYDADLQSEGFPQPVLDAGRQIRAAGAVLFVTPEYNYSVPGGLKNAIDWLSRLPEQPFSGKAAGIAGASPGNVGTARMQSHLRQILVFLNAFPVNRPQVMVGNAAERFDADGVLVDGTTRGILQQLLGSVAELAGRLG